MSVICLRGLTVHLPGQAEPVLDAIDLEVPAGAFVLLLGESGAGKTMLVSALSGLLPVGAQRGGSVRIGGSDPAEAGRPPAPPVAVPVFQAPLAGLSPVRRIGAQITDALALAGQRSDALPGLLQSLGLDGAVAHLHAGALSGGMAQRVAVARAVATGAQVILADEPTSALDGPNALRVLETLAAVSRAGRTVLMVTHDPWPAARYASHVAVLHRGRLVEAGQAGSVMSRPRHPYLKALLAAVPARALDLGALVPLPDPEPFPAGGCRFGGQCRLRLPRCEIEVPRLVADRDRHAVACHRSVE